MLKHAKTTPTAVGCVSRNAKQKGLEFVQVNPANKAEVFKLC